jgi:two-component system sensor kinase FixL
MPGDRVTILVVDDDRGLLRLIEKSLRPAGYTIAKASSGEDALSWLASNDAELMVLDLKLQDFEGTELINKLSQSGNAVPFIVITGQGDERVAVNIMKQGALDYLVKDAQFLDVLPTVVNRAVDQLTRDKKLKAAEEALRTSEERFRVALKNSAIHVFSQDVELSYTWFHNAPVGFTETDFIKKKDAELFPPEEAMRLSQIKQRALRTGVGVREEVKCTLRGETRIYDLTIEPIKDSAGMIIGITGAALDITDRKRLEQEISQVSEMEQRRIGQDLHDGICQHLAGIELMSQVLEQNLEKKSRPHAVQAGEIAKNVREAIAQTRSLARGLSPVELELEGLMSALDELSENTTKLFRMSCEFVCEKPVLIANNTAATHLYRIAQEAVSNGIRHGKAKQITISLSSQHDKIVLAVQDKGKGFSPEGVSTGGLGLRIMQYRAGMIGGNLTIKTGNEGTLVTCILPKTAVNPATR